MARLTSAQRDSILRSMVNHVKKHLTRGLEEQIKAHSDVLYEISMPKHVRTAIEVMPRNLFRHDSSFEVICRGHRVSHVTAYLSEEKAIPYCLQPLELRLGDEGAMPVYDQITGLTERMHQQQRRTYEFQRLFQWCLELFTSPNKLVHHWPEVFDFLPAGVQLSDRIRDFSITSRQESALNQAREVYNRLLRGEV